MQHVPIIKQCGPPVKVFPRTIQMSARGLSNDWHASRQHPFSLFAASGDTDKHYFWSADSYFRVLLDAVEKALTKEKESRT